MFKKSDCVLGLARFQVLSPACHELTPRGCAGRLDVVVLELHSLCRELIQHRCTDIFAVIADVIEALVIRHDEDNVWGSIRRTSRFSS